MCSLKLQASQHLKREQQQQELLVFQDSVITDWKDFPFENRIQQLLAADSNRHFLVQELSDFFLQGWKRCHQSWSQILFLIHLSNLTRMTKYCCSSPFQHSLKRMVAYFHFPITHHYFPFSFLQLDYSATNIENIDYSIQNSKASYFSMERKLSFTFHDWLCQLLGFDWVSQAYQLRL